MRRLLWASAAFAAAGVASGLFYREFTKLNDWPEGQATQLGLVHTHLLVLGFFLMLIVLLLERAFVLSRSRAFGWFFWLYSAGVVLTAAMLTVHGMLTVLGRESGAMIAGIAGLGHMLLTAGLVLLFVALAKAVRPVERPAAEVREPVAA